MNKHSLMKKLLLSVIVVVGLIAFTSATWAESGCHDRGNRGPVTVAGR